MMDFQNKHDGTIAEETGSPLKTGKALTAKKEHWIFLDVCKVISVLLIAVMHVSAGAWGEAAAGSFDWHVLNVFYSLSRIGIPLFFMQVGAVFLNEDNDFALKFFCKKYVLRIISAFFFWSAFYLVIYYLADAPGTFAKDGVLTVLKSFFAGAPHSQWFIILAIGLYLVIPILKAISKDINICKYFLFLWILFSILLPAVYRVLYLIPGIPANISGVIGIISDSVIRVKPSLVLDFPGYMLLGCYIHRKTFSARTTTIFSILGLLAFAYTVLMTAHISIQNSLPSESFFGNFSVNICLMCIGTMLLIKLIIKNIWFGDKLYKGLRFFSDVSFGIFLIHDFLRMGLVRLGIYTLSFPPIISVPVLSVVIFTLSGAIAYWLRNIPVIGPYIVGD